MYILQNQFKCISIRYHIMYDICKAYRINVISKLLWNMISIHFIHSTEYSWKHRSHFRYYTHCNCIQTCTCELTWNYWCILVDSYSGMHVHWPGKLAYLYYCWILLCWNVLISIDQQRTGQWSILIITPSCSVYVMHWS